MSKRDPKNIKHQDIIVTDLAQVMKKQRDFLKWMSRRYFEENPEQSAAFKTGAELLDEIRISILEGDFDFPGSEPQFISSRELDKLFDEED